MENKPLYCIDLFAGAGGFSLAAQNIGFSVAAAIELNRHACDTYEANLINGNSTKLYNRDILEISPTEILNDCFNAEKQCDIVLGGPPCQGFSIHRINNSGIDDPRNKLILRYFEFVKVLKPRVFLMENVPGILWLRHRKFLDAFYEAGEKAGYRLMPPVTLDARDFGLPQRRKRIFILGIRPDVEFNVSWPPAPTHGDIQNVKHNPRLQPWQTAAHVFEKPVDENDENNIHMNHTAELIEVFKSTPLNGGSRKHSNRVLPCHENHKGHQDVYGRIDPNQPGPTMTTACTNPSKGRFVHPTEHHGISVRHAARFQTFPDSFVFKGGIIAASQQIGNAVPVKLGEVLLRTIANGLNFTPDH
ncbi:DNA cytosine methyltransferase [Methylovulum miyakonense]|uniref:DNA cytosine methyltransferase n=1 Tax=Methylovulum miyakonense TaxID=645578 RepID=UPI000379777A|nr:DNA cytosine methyltransferase [Methylovulum miyakonense]